MNEPRNTPTKVEPSNLPPGTTPGVTHRIAELTGMVEPSGFSDAVRQEDETGGGSAYREHVAGPDHTSEPAELRDPTPEEAAQHVAAQGGAEDVTGIPDDPEAAIEEERAREAEGEPRRLTPLEEAALTDPTREADDLDAEEAALTDPTHEAEPDEDTGDIGTDEGFERAWREAMSRPIAFELPDTTTTDEEYDRRRKALEDVRSILGPASSAAFANVGRDVADLVYVAEWLLDKATPVRIPRFAGEEPTDG